MVIFYSRPNCQLCNDGMELLKIIQLEKTFTIEVVNIEEDDELHEKYMMYIPVVEQNGEIIQSGLLDYITLLEGIKD